MATKIKIKKGDLVKVLSGDSKGQEGKVIEINSDKYTALVEGINISTKHSKPTASNTNGGIVKKEAPVHISNLMLIEPGTGKPTRVGRQLDEKTKNLVRVSRKSGNVIK